MPLFMLASVTETKTSPAAFVAPAWRLVLGNLAAGAVSGCAVEAGESDAICERPILGRWLSTERCGSAAVEPHSV